MKKTTLEIVSSCRQQFQFSEMILISVRFIKSDQFRATSVLQLGQELIPHLKSGSRNVILNKRLMEETLGQLLVNCCRFLRRIEIGRQNGRLPPL